MLQWKYNGKSLLLLVNGKPPVNVSYPHSLKVVTEIRECEKNGTLNDAPTVDRIYNFAISAEDVSDKNIAIAMNKSGVEGISFNDKTKEVELFDKPIKGAIGRHIARLVQRNNFDFNNVNWQPVAKFFNRLSANPTASEELFNWLSANDFSIASDGRIICYKGVDAKFNSTHQGVGAWTDSSGQDFYSPESDMAGYRKRKNLVYKPGSSVYMLREDCDPRSQNPCSTGIHFGTQDYADYYGTKTMLCLVAPEDVVSTPSDDYRKARASRIEVIGELPSRGIFVDSPVADFRDNDDSSTSIIDATNVNEKREIGINVSIEKGKD